MKPRWVNFSTGKKSLTALETLGVPEPITLTGKACANKIVPDQRLLEEQSDRELFFFFLHLLFNRVY